VMHAKVYCLDLNPDPSLARPAHRRSNDTMTAFLYLFSL
jgi:hypothetical protein